MRVHLLHVVETESDVAQPATDELPIASNDATCDAPGFAAATAILVQRLDKASRHPGINTFAITEDDAYTLGGYAGI